MNKIHKLVGIIQEKERIPEEWKLSIIYPLHKKGDKLDCQNYRGISLHKKGDKLNCQNYRGISLPSTSYTTFTTILKNKLENNSRILGRIQARTINIQSHFHSQTNIGEMLGIQCKCLTYRDFRQAYDSVRRKKMYETLQHFQVPNKLLRLVKVTVDSTVANVQVLTEMMELFEIRGGLEVGGGYGLEPLLFNLVMEYVMRKVTVDRNTTLQNKLILIVRYTDCVCIMGRMKEAMKQIYEEWKRAVREVGLFFNPLNLELNPNCHLLALLGAHHILHVSRIRVNVIKQT